MKIIFWNVDTQHDFMRPDGKLYVQGAEQIEGVLFYLTELAKNKAIKVVNTADWHNQNSGEISDNPDFIKTFPEHCMQDTPGAQFIPSTRPEDPYIINWEQKDFDIKEALSRRNIVLYKDKFDVFKGTSHSDKIVQLLNPERAIVYGVATNVCVNDAVLGLLERKVKVYVVSDAIKELPGLPLPYDVWKEKGATLIPTKDIYEMILEEKC